LQFRSPGPDDLAVVRWSSNDAVTGRVLPFDSSAHSAADVLLPWYINGTLRGEELAFVEQHVRACERCRREADWLRDVFAACAAIGPVQDSVRTRANRQTGVDVQQGFPARIARGWRTAQPLVRGLLAAQLAAIVVLGTLFMMDTHGDASYRTLGTTNRSAQVRDAVAVMFDPTITESEMRRLVLGVGARIVDGPTSTNAFVLEVPAAQSDRAVQSLRSDKRVRFAERLGPGTSP
jgi:hypothetical protein